MSLIIPPAYPIIVKTEEATLGNALALQLYHSPSPYRSPSSTSASNNTTLVDSEWSEPHIHYSLFEGVNVGLHPGEGWIPNDPLSPHYHHIELPAIYGGKVANYIKYVMDPTYPLILGTMSKGAPIHSHLLHPRPKEHLPPPLTQEPRRGSSIPINHSRNGLTSPWLMRMTTHSWPEYSITGI